MTDQERAAFEACREQSPIDIWNAALAWLRSQAEPIATLHDDGYWTWKNRANAPHESNYAGWRMDVFAAPQPAIPNRVVNAISVMVADAMAQAAANGANSISMPDEYVEVALWLSKLPDDTDPQPAIPDGWKLVPMEPTEEMLRSAFCEAGGSYENTKGIYRAMLATAPEPSK